MCDGLEKSTVPEMTSFKPSQQPAKHDILTTVIDFKRVYITVWWQNQADFYCLSHPPSGQSHIPYIIFHVMYHINTIWNILKHLKTQNWKLYDYFYKINAIYQTEHPKLKAFMIKVNHALEIVEDRMNQDQPDKAPLDQTNTKH